MDKDYGENTEKEEKDEEERRKRQMAAIARRKCNMLFKFLYIVRFGRKRNFGKKESYFLRKINSG